jgi:SET domain-containing protein
VGCDKKDYAFYALRNIKAGEELTLDYSKFSELPQI